MSLDFSILSDGGFIILLVFNIEVINALKLCIFTVALLFI